MSAASLVSPLPPGPPRRTRSGGLMLPKPKTPLRFIRSSLMDQITGPLPDRERELLRAIAKHAELIGPISGGVSEGYSFLLVALTHDQVEDLCAFEADM